MLRVHEVSEKKKKKKYRECFATVEISQVRKFLQLREIVMPSLNERKGLKLVTKML